MAKHRDCCNENDRQSKLYKAMREIGVENWCIVLVESFEVQSFEEQRKKEREKADELNPTLNSDNAYRSGEEKHQQLKEGYIKYNQSEKGKHRINKYFATEKGKLTKKTNDKKYYESEKGKQRNQRMKQIIRGKCDLCNYQTCHTKDFNKHLQTNKHKRAVEQSELEENNEQE
jgi:hypothetical protein